MQRLSATPSALASAGIQVNQDGRHRTAADLLRYPDIDIARLSGFWPELGSLSLAVVEQIEIDGRYAGYLERQEADIRAYRRDEALLLPADLDYKAISGLSNEAREQLDAARPATLGAAARISGVTPAAVITLLRYVKQRGGARAATRGDAA